ncbi:hypothetical protein MAR_007608, partial [Mya arenaria]
MKFPRKEQCVLVDLSTMIVERLVRWRSVMMFTKAWTLLENLSIWKCLNCFKVKTSSDYEEIEGEAGFLSTHNAKAYPAPFPVAGKMGHGKANGGPVTDSNHNNSNTNCDNLYNDVMV